MRTAYSARVKSPSQTVPLKQIKLNLRQNLGDISRVKDKQITQVWLTQNSVTSLASSFTVRDVYTEIYHR